MQFVDALERVVEGDDATWTRVLFHVFQHLVGCETVGVVACHEVPHDDGEAMAQTYVLRVPHPSVRWPEKVAVNEVVGLQHIAMVAAGLRNKLDVIVRVIADTMATAQHLFIEFGVLVHVVAYHEEGCLHAVTVQCIKNPRRSFGDRTIVERQIYTTFVGVHTPDGTRVEPTEPRRGLFDKHRRVVYCRRMPSDAQRLANG